MGYKNKTVTKKRSETRTRIIPGAGIETYVVEVPYEVIESVWEPDTSSYESTSYSGGE